MILDGRILSNLIADELRTQATGQNIGLAIVLVGEDPSSIKYVNAKQKRALDIGIDCKVLQLPAELSEAEVMQFINMLNNNNNTHGMMVQLPLPGHICAQTIMRAINPLKDVDGLNPASNFIPATVRGIEKLLEHYLYGPHFDLQGDSAVVIGRSEIVGKPAAKMLLDHNATVTICHSKTPDLMKFTAGADILISATGITGLITPEYIKQGAVIIDAGTIGDVAPECYLKASAYTPVPGGVGPMTIISLLENTIRAHLKQK